MVSAVMLPPSIHLAMPEGLQTEGFGNIVMVPLSEVECRWCRRLCCRPQYSWLFQRACEQEVLENRVGSAL